MNLPQVHPDPPFILLLFPLTARSTSYCVWGNGCVGGRTFSTDLVFHCLHASHFSLYFPLLTNVHALFSLLLPQRVPQLTSLSVTFGELCEIISSICPEVRFSCPTIYAYLISGWLPEWKQYMRSPVSLPSHQYLIWNTSWSFSELKVILHYFTFHSLDCKLGHLFTFFLSNIPFCM